LNLVHRLENARLVSWPQPAGREDYELAAREIEAALRRVPGVVSIYQTGSVSAPGISDLDLIAVVDASGRLPPVWPGFTERTRYLAMHGPFLVDVSSFVRHTWFASLDPLVHLWGDRLRLAEGPPRDGSELRLAAEGMVVALLGLVKQAVTGRVKVRPFLCELNNLRRQLQLAGLARDHAPGAWAAAEAVTAARVGWFQESAPAREELVRTLLERVVEGIRDGLAGAAGRAQALFGADAAVTPLRLSGPWSNVLLVPERDGSIASLSTGRLGSAVPSSRSRRAAELRWRLTSATLGVPAPVVSVLGEGPGGDAPFRRERLELLRQYHDFLSRQGPGWSAIGQASAFLAHGR
jgi:hypothetical protein